MRKGVKSMDIITKDMILKMLPNILRTCIQMDLTRKSIWKKIKLFCIHILYIIQKIWNFIRIYKFI